MNALIFAGAISALAAIPVLIAAAVTVAIFFRSRKPAWGYANDLLSAAGLLLLILPALTVNELSQATSGDWAEILAWVAIAGMVIAAAGQVALVLGL
ncbi:MAG: hypothetical protein HY682_11350, partial [Chloroflexi bacterium]|nr:hypothetical protein [Chloroflexota bacterium]